MTIDNRVLLPIAGPFVILGMIRLLCWLAGVEWSQPGIAVVMSIAIGGMGGLAIMAIMMDTGDTIGSFTIGKGDQPHD